MSIRLRLTLLYSAILALTLVVFGILLYTIHAQETLDAIQLDLSLNGERLSRSIEWMQTHPRPPEPDPSMPRPGPFEAFSGEQAFRELRERDVMRLLDGDGELVASPFGGEDAPLPLSSQGLEEVQAGQVWWQMATLNGERMLIYNVPVVVGGETEYIAQIGRRLTERDRSLASLGRTLAGAGLLTTLVAFGIGWVLSGLALRPIHRITQTAQSIGNESDFAKRVDYHGPNDEIGQLAITFNSMLARLQDAYQKVSQTLHQQREFVADVSHELRTPLTTIRGNLALLRLDPPVPSEEQADILSDLVEESERLIRLVNDLLVLARADTGRSLAIEPVAIQPVISEALRQARQLDDQRAIVEIVSNEVILGDRDALKQIMLILVDNALKHSQGEIQVSAQAADGMVVVRVQDEGPGMAPDVLSHVFDRFYRAESSVHVPGFGLGLPIAKTLVEAQGGAISVESQVGQGTTVTLRLIRAREQPSI